MIPIVKPWLPPLESYVAFLQEIWDSRMLSNFADFSQRLEELARGYLGAKQVLATSSGDTGLIVTLKALDLPQGSPCFMSSFTFNSTVNAALWNGLRPVLVDIDPLTLNLSPEGLDAAMDRWDQPGVVLATHVFGNPCDIPALETRARKHGAFLVFDAAHAYGSLSDGRMVGTFGDAEVFSLSGTKLVTSAEGGLIATPHEWLAERVIHLRAYGFQNDYVSKYVGLNGKLSELHAALGVLTLPEIENIVERRHEIVRLYLEELDGVVSGQQVRSQDRSTYKDVFVRVGEARPRVEAKLTRAGVQVKRYFLPLHTMDPYSPYADHRYSETDSAFTEGLCLPAFMDISDDTIRNICARVRQAIEG